MREGEGENRDVLGRERESRASWWRAHPVEGGSRRWQGGSPASNTQVLDVSTKKTANLQKAPWLCKFSRERTKQPKIWYKNHVLHLFKLLKTPGLFC
jgi:hypothetical protein